MDRNVKWFQELFYIPHKDHLTNYFKSLHELKHKFPNDRDLNEGEKIKIINSIKSESEKFLIEFVNILQSIAPDLYKSLSEEIDKLTDELTNVIDDDRLKLAHPMVFQSEISNRIARSKSILLKSMFNYKG